KASSNVGKADLRGLKSFSEISDKKPIKMILYMGEYSRKLDDVSILPLNQEIKFISQQVI
ncbi:MAG: hypothetical protein WCH11_06850, partial [Bdellovibrio sp.]